MAYGYQNIGRLFRKGGVTRFLCTTMLKNTFVDFFKEFQAKNAESRLKRSDANFVTAYVPIVKEFVKFQVGFVLASMGQKVFFSPFNFIYFYLLSLLGKYEIKKIKPRETVVVR